MTREQSVAEGSSVTGDEADPTAPPRAPRTARLVASICVLGVLLTGLASWTAARVDSSTEERILEVQGKQAASVLTSAVTALQAPLSAALVVHRISGGGPVGDQAASMVLGEDVGEKKRFASASVWRAAEEGPLRRTATVGGSAGPQSDEPAMSELVDSAVADNTLAVTRVDAESGPRIAYALADRGSGTAVYAEQAIPADGRATVDRDSAFAEIEYAIYLGPVVRASAVATTNVDPASLPMTGDVTYRTAVPFGNTVLTLVARPRDHLGSPLGRRLPILLLIGGLLLTGVTAVVAGKLMRARSAAEADTGTIRSLYERVDSLYADQRELFVGLQRALLPQADPHIPHVDVAAEYVAGADGIDIGGDWYSVLRIDEDRFAFVVGDVSGRGIDAVAEMARARFTLRAYLVEGHEPAEALTMCSHQFDVLTDGHIITVLVGIGDHRTGDLLIANAGHPRPLMASNGTAEFVPMPVGPPLGVGASTYVQATAAMPAGATLICFTDGLVERRTESIDSGLERLVRTVEPHLAMPLHQLVEHVLAVMGDDAAPDDTAILALRREARATGTRVTEPAGPLGDVRA